jgi:hypothetical protein
MIEITENTSVFTEDESKQIETETKYYAIKTDTGRYLRRDSYHNFTVYANNAQLWRTTRKAIEHAKKILGRFENVTHKPFSKLFVTEMKLIEAEKGNG